MRLGFECVEYSARRRPTDGIDEITVQLEESTSIRTLLAQQPPDRELACAWAAEWVTELEGRDRPRASLTTARCLPVRRQRRRRGQGDTPAGGRAMRRIRNDPVSGRWRTTRPVRSCCAAGRSDQRSMAVGSAAHFGRILEGRSHRWMRSFNRHAGTRGILGQHAPTRGSVPLARRAADRCRSGGGR